MTSEEILASITAHYMVTDRLTTAQLGEHKRRGACAACEPPRGAGELARALPDEVKTSD